MRPLFAFAILAASGCGGRTGMIVDDEPTVDAASEVAFTDTGSSDASLDTGDAGPACTVDARPIPAPDCPIVLPRNGTPCHPPKSGRCEYVGCDQDVNDVAICSADARTWVVHTAPCATGPARCPIEQPVGGAPCDLGDELCWYDDECLRRTRAECDPISRTWIVDRAASCAARARCPTTAPERGTRCGGCPGTTLTCEYRNGCGLYDTLTCDGDTGLWAAIEEPCVTAPSCPRTEPAIGESCGPLADGTHCAWSVDCGLDEHHPWSTVDDMDCVAGRWRMFHRGRCAPMYHCHAGPMLDMTGHECADGDVPCSYPSGDGCSMTCKCVFYGGLFGRLECSSPPCAGDALGK